MDRQNKIFHKLGITKNASQYSEIPYNAYTAPSWLRFTVVCLYTRAGESVGWAWDHACCSRQTQGFWFGISIREEGGGRNVWSCRLWDQQFAAYLCNQATAVLGQYAGSRGDRSRLGERKQIRDFMHQSFSGALLQLSSARSWRLYVVPWKTVSLSFLVCKMGTTFHFLNWFEICGCGLHSYCD